MGVYVAGRRDHGGIEEDEGAWIRLTSACDQACVFCLDADHLDGSIRSLEAVTADLDAAVDGGHRRVILSGGEPTRSPHLPAIVRAASSRGLEVAMTTHGGLLASRRACATLKEAGLDEVRISLHSGVRSTHDLLVGRHGAWVRSLSGMRTAATEGLVVTLHMVLTQDNTIDLGHLAHLGAMAGVARARLFRMRPEGSAARGGLRHQGVSDAVALKTLDRLWRDAGAEGLAILAVGFDDTRHVLDDPTLEPWDGGPPPIDAAGLAMLRRGVGLRSLTGGCTAADHDGRMGRFLELASAAGGVRALCAELEAVGSPVVDLPRCLGAAGRAGAGKYVAVCESCPERSECPGLPGVMARRHADIVGWDDAAISADRRKDPA